MKYLFITFLASLFSCSCYDPSKERKCKRLDSNTVEFLYINKKYNDGDTIMYRNGEKEDKYMILSETIKLKQ